MYLYSHSSIHIHIHLFIFIFIYLYSHSSIYIHIHLFIFTFIYLYSHSSIYIHIHLFILTFIYLYSHSCYNFYIQVFIFTFMLPFHIHSYACTVLFIHVQPVVHLKFPDDVMPSITRILAIILHCKMNGSVGGGECRSLCTRKVIGSSRLTGFCEIWTLRNCEIKKNLDFTK